MQAQVEQFEISYPFKGLTTVVNFDNQGYLWFPNSNRTDYYRYYGQGIDELGLPELLNIQSEHYLTDRAIFVDALLLLKREGRLSLFDLQSQSIVSNWEFPSDLFIDYIHTDDKGVIWVFTQNKKNKTRPVFKSTNGKDYELIFDLFVHLGDKQISWWSGLSDAEGVFYFHDKLGDLLLINAQGERQDLYLADPKKYEDKYDCSVFRLDNKNNLWRHHHQEFAIYNEQLGKFITHPLSNKLDSYSDCPDFFKLGFEINFIWTDYQGRQWLGGADSNLYMYDRAKDELTFFGKTIVDELGGKGGEIHSFIGDGIGNFYGAKRGGVFKFSEQQSYFESYVVNTKNKKHPIYNKLPEQVISYMGEEHFTNANITSINEDQNEDLFFTDYRFVYKLNTATGEEVILPIFTPQSKIGVFFVNDNQLISSRGFVVHFDEQYKLIPHSYSPMSVLGNIFEQKSGTIWFTGFQKSDFKLAQYTGLFAQVDSQTLAFSGNYIDPAGKVNFDQISIQSIDEDQDENLWLGTRTGIYKIITAEDGRVQSLGGTFLYKQTEITFAPQIGINAQTLQDKHIGIQTKYELAVLNGETKELEQYVSVEKLGLKEIFSAYFVNDSIVWFSSTSGLNYLEFATNKTLHFSTNEGFNGTNADVIKPLKNGKLAVGTSNGLYVFQPDLLLMEFAQKELQLKKSTLSLNAYSYLHGDSDTIQKTQFFTSNFTPLELTHQDRMLSFDFALLDFKNPKQHQFSYWLQGYDRQWSSPSTDSNIKFTSLPAGKYMLKVRANNGNGIWSDHVLSIPIHIQPAWYKTWWFFIGSILAFLALAFLLFRYYLSIAKKRLNLELQQKEATRIKELDEVKNLFFTNITHEFKTPLTVIMGVNDYSDAQEEEKSLIRNNSNHLLDLINQLLDLSKIESKEIKLSFSQGNIIPYLKYLTSSFHSMASDKNIQLYFYTDLGELVINYDETRIQQIIYNLLSNALKFTTAGGSVFMAVKKINLSGHPQLSITIKDTGCGIPEKELPFIFDHFYQVSNPITKIGEGTGVGLALSRGLLHLMNGEIQVQSKLNHGTEFTVLLPIQTEWSEDLVPSSFVRDNMPSDSMLSQVIASKETTDRSEANKSTDSKNELPILLLIEDHPDVVTYISSLLKDSYQVVICRNGAAGIEKAIEIIPDIIISDVMMPIKNGYEVCETLKQDHKTDHIPIILLTAKSRIEDKLEGLKFGADAYLKKPFNKEELFIRLEQLLLVRKKIQERYIEELKQVKSSEVPPKDEFAYKLKQIVLDHLADTNFGVPELATALLMSQSQIFRKTKAILGLTPLLFIRSLRLAKAKELLKNNALNISEVATQSGFASPNYFSRSFQNEFGTSPSDFRKRL